MGDVEQVVAVEPPLKAVSGSALWDEPVEEPPAQSLGKVSKSGRHFHTHDVWVEEVWIGGRCHTTWQCGCGETLSSETAVSKKPEGSLWKA